MSFRGIPYASYYLTLLLWASEAYKHNKARIQSEIVQAVKPKI